MRCSADPSGHGETGGEKIEQFGIGSQHPTDCSGGIAQVLCIGLEFPAAPMPLHPAVAVVEGIAKLPAAPCLSGFGCQQSTAI